MGGGEAGKDYTQGNQGDTPKGQDDLVDPRREGKRGRKREEREGKAQALLPL